MKLLLALCILVSATMTWADTVPGVTDVRVISHEGKTVELLTDVKGFTLYTFDPDVLKFYRKFINLVNDFL